jgi:hypothetical protein
MVEGPVKSCLCLPWLLAVLLALVMPEWAAGQHAVSIVDTHTHPAGSIGRMTVDDFRTRALRAMKEYQIEKTIVLPPPTRVGKLYRQRWPEFVDLVKAHPSSFAFGAGPEQLNSLILTTPADAVSSDVRRKFEVIGKRLIDSGVSVLGEFVAEHFSFGQYPYMSVAPDHPLLLLLADIAARGRVPVDLHMEALPTDRPMPDLWPGRRNPPQTDNPVGLKANLPAFERLLAHNANAKIVWVHAGWDNTGERTVGLMRGLLAKHPNLYMSIKVTSRRPGLTTPFALFGGIRGEWLELFREFSDRFVIGSDHFYDEDPALRMDPMRDFVNALPGELANKIARENAMALYRLSE